MTISLDKDILNDLSLAQNYEWLERNELGVYASSSAVGMNTRREHGLYAVPDQSFKKHIILLSKLEDTVFIENRLHEISTNTYQTGVFPTGFTYLQEFSINPFPRFTYNIEGRIIEKTLFLLSNQSTLVIRYELKNQGSPLNIILKPFLAERPSTEITNEMQGLNTDSYLGHQFVRWSLKAKMPELYVYFSQGEFAPATLWYKNFVYTKDNGRYKNDKLENLFNPGFFQATLTPYSTLDLYISANELDTSLLNYEALYRAENSLRNKSVGVAFEDNTRLIRAEKSLRRSYKTLDRKSIISISELENVYTTRDIIFSMPGLFLATKEYDLFKSNYQVLIKQLSEGLLPVHSPLMRDKNHYSASDLSLWLINLGYLYFQKTNDVTIFDGGVYESYRSIFDHYIKGTLNNIYLDNDKLIFCGNKASSTSWIPLTSGGGEVLRYGKLLEVNALWYNALRIFEDISEKMGKKRKATKYSKLADEMETSFNKTFLQGEYPADFVANSEVNDDFRINQLVPLALPFSILN